MKAVNDLLLNASEAQCRVLVLPEKWMWAERQQFLLLAQSPNHCCRLLWVFNLLLVKKKVLKSFNWSQNLYKNVLHVPSESSEYIKPVSEPADRCVHLKFFKTCIVLEDKSLRLMLLFTAASSASSHQDTQNCSDSQPWTLQHFKSQPNIM